MPLHTPSPDPVPQESANDLPIADPMTGAELPLAKSLAELRDLFRGSPHFVEPTSDTDYEPFSPKDAD